MSRRSAPDSPWQNGMPPFGLCQQQQFNPMMNCGPMWPQHNLSLMGGSMTPDIMRFRGMSSRGDFRYNYSQLDRYGARQIYGERFGNRQGIFLRGDRKRPAPGHRSRSPAPKKPAPRRDGGRKAEQDRTKQQESDDEQASTQEEEATGARDDDLYDPAEPTQEDVADGAEKSEGNEDESAKAAEEIDGGEPGGADGENAVPKDGSGDTAETDAATEDKEGLEKAGAKTAIKPVKPAGSGAKVLEPKPPIKGQSAGRSSFKKDASARQGQGPRKSGTKGKGWCTVCEIHFDCTFLDHRRTQDHKMKRDQKYPKCHPCSMGFNNRKQYENHCAGEFHRKNVELHDNEAVETADLPGEEYLEEVRAYFCTLCKLLVKTEMKSDHCRTQGHFRRHKDIKREEEAAAKAKSEKEKQTEEEEEDVSQISFTVTDEIFSDEESKAATDAAAEAAKEPKQDKPIEGSHTAATVQGPPDAVKEEPPAEEKAQLENKVKSEPPEDEHSAEDDAALEDAKQVAEIDSCASVDTGEVELKVSSVPDTNGCKTLKEEVEEQQRPVPASSVPATPKATVPKPSKVPIKSAPTPRAAVMTPKPAGPATKAPAAKIGTAVSSAAKIGTAASSAAKVGTAVGSAAATSASAVPTTTATAPVKKPPAVAGTQGPAAAAGGRGGMVRGRGRGAPKAVRARKR